MFIEGRKYGALGPFVQTHISDESARKIMLGKKKLLAEHFARAGEMGLH